MRGAACDYEPVAASEDGGLSFAAGSSGSLSLVGTAELFSISGAGSLSFAAAGGRTSRGEEITSAGDVALTNSGGETSPILDGGEVTDIGGDAGAEGLKAARNWSSVTQVEPRQSSAVFTLWRLSQGSGNSVEALKSYP